MGHPRIEALPVFRHGSEAARICDEALSVMGPTDSRISRCVQQLRCNVETILENDFVMTCRIIQSDQNAQMAFHIHKALGYALDVSDKLCGEFNV